MDKRDKDLLNKIEACIPAYRPAPCECCVKRENPGGQFYYWPDCDCGNTGDLIEAARWCAHMEVADNYQTILDKLDEPEREMMVDENGNRSIFDDVDG